MAELRPFRALRYDLARVSLSDVVAPPYDVISPEQQAELYAASPYNVVRLILGRETDRYTEAAQYLARWKSERILVRDNEPAIYLLQQEFTLPDATSVKRTGFIARCRLEDIGNGSVLPHEKTLAKPKEDRFRLLQATHANFSQIFGLYSDPDHVISSLFYGAMQSPEEMNVEFEGVRNLVWRITDDEMIAVIVRFMAGKTILVADGHHRYETAVSYRNSRRLNHPAHTGDEAYNFIMMYHTNMHDRGLVVLPTHRVLHNLRGFSATELTESLAETFELIPCAGERELTEVLSIANRRSYGLVISDPMRYLLLRLKDGVSPKTLLGDLVPEVLLDLDVSLLHGYIFGRLLGISSDAQEQKSNLDYFKDSASAIATVSSGFADAAFLMNATPVEQVRTVAEGGHTMPQKSTYFYPKLLSGLLINPTNEL